MTTFEEFFFCYKLIFFFNHFTFSQFLNIDIKLILIMFNKEESKNRINKKSFNRRLKSRNRYSSATNLKSFNSFVIFLLNDTNQSTAKNKNKENEQIKMLNTIKSYFKAISFFQNISLTKNYYNIKLNFENFVFFYYYNRQFAKKNQ